MADLLNALICALILMCILPAAFVMPHRGLWLVRLTLWAIALWAGWWLGCALFEWAQANTLIVLLNVLMLTLMLAGGSEIMGTLRRAAR
jgi:hypothetical protein